MHARRANGIFETPVSGLQVQRVRFAVEIRDEQIQSAVAVGVVGRDAHRGLSAAVLVKCRACEQSFFDEAQRAAAIALGIHEEEVGRRVVRHVDTQSA